MVQEMPKHKIKDSVFTNKHVLVDADYNDLGFSVGNRLIVLVESQSTWTFNIIIRALMYLIQTYHDYFKRTSQNLYGSKKVNMPKPELYVIYTGERKNVPDTITLRKEFFGGEKVAIDVEVNVLYQENETDIIGQYIIFCKVYNEQRKRYGTTKQAVTETIRICKNRNVLKEYLESKEQEVYDIMMTLFDQEYAVERYGEEKKAEGLAEGALKQAKETAFSLKAEGFSDTMIAKILHISLDTIRQWSEGDSDMKLLQ